MVQQLAAEILTSDSDEIADLKTNLSTLEGFIDLAREIDSLPDTKKRFFEESRSLYQVTTIGKNIEDLEAMLADFFGSAVKPSGKPLPRKLRKNSVVKYLGGIQKDQSLFLVQLKTGHFYGALWPWRRNKAKIEVHFGYCSDWMSDDDYMQLETLVQHAISKSAFKKMDAGIGGQIHGISLPSFLQMAEMEKSSFSLRITSQSRVGNLHLENGRLIEATADNANGAEAAYQVISWDEVSIEIEPLDDSVTDNIKLPLMQVLMESLKLKDELMVPDTAPDEPLEEETEAVIPPAIQSTPRSQRPSPGRLVRLERAPEPRIKRQRINILTMAAIALGALGLIAVAYTASLHFANTRRASDGLERVLVKAESSKSLENKKELYQEYLDSYPKSQHVPEIEHRLSEVAKKIEDRDYDQVQLKISVMPVDENYEKNAIATYESFLGKYPNSNHKREINRAIGKIKDLIDQYYYEELKQAARLDFSERLDIYRNYLAKFPEGSYGRDVQILIDKMGERHLEFLNSEAAKCKAKQQWEPCIQQYDAFAKAYAGTDIGNKAIEQKSKVEDQRDYFELHRKVMDLGTDYQQSYRLYQSYLATHPQSSQRKTIEKEMDSIRGHLKGQEQWIAVQNYASNPSNSLILRIQRVDTYLKRNLTSPYANDAQTLLAHLETERKRTLRQQKIDSKKRQEQERIRREKEQQAQKQRRIRRMRTQVKSQLSDSKRFKANADGTVVDRSTGLTWALLDSYQELGGCITFEAAQTYIQNLSTESGNRWRFPTASELASIYKTAPYYPGTGNQWYWSSENYSKGYHSVVVVVTDKQETVFKRENRATTECGVVRAVQ